MMKFNNKDINKMYIGDTLVNRINDGDFQYMAKHDYSQDYLAFDIISSGTIFWRHSLDISAKTISYSLDNGSTWADITSNTGSSAPSISVNTGDKILFKGTNAEYGTNNGVNNFLRSTASFNVYGNIMSLVYGDNFTGQTLLEGTHTFRELFRDTNVVSAENLILPATTLAQYCYQSMFNGCKSLATAPVLPATALARGCYSSMFKGCTSLTTAPELHATTLVDYCHNTMFSGCTSLNYIKCLATDISATDCTKNWVSGVAGTGTFAKTASMDSWTTGASGIPDGWTIENE